MNYHYQRHSGHDGSSTDMSDDDRQKNEEKLSKRKSRLKRIKDEEDSLERFARGESRMDRESERRKKKLKKSSNHKSNEKLINDSSITKEKSMNQLKQAGARSGFTKAELVAAQWKKQMERSDDNEMEDPLITIQKGRFKEDAPPTSTDVKNPLIDSQNLRAFIKFQKEKYKKVKKEEKRRAKDERRKKRRKRNRSSSSYERSKSSDCEGQGHRNKNKSRSRSYGKDSSSGSSEGMKHIVDKLKDLSHNRRIGVLNPVIHKPDEVVRKNSSRYSNKERVKSSSVRNDKRVDEFGRILREKDKERRLQKSRRSRSRSNSDSSSSLSSSVSSQFWDHLSYAVREKEEEEEGGISIWEYLYGRRRDASEMGFDTRKGAWRSRAGGVYLPAEDEMENFDEEYINQKPIDMERVVIQKYFNEHDPVGKESGKKKEVGENEEKNTKNNKIKIESFKVAVSDDDSSSLEFFIDS